MTDATTKLLSVVSEAGGGPWIDSPGLSEDLLTEWLGAQEDRGDGLRDTVIRKQEELARLEEVVEADFIGPLEVDQGMGPIPHPFELSVRTSQGQDTREQASRDQDQRAPGLGRGRREAGSMAPWKHLSR